VGGDDDDDDDDDDDNNNNVIVIVVVFYVCILLFIPTCIFVFTLEESCICSDMDRRYNLVRDDLTTCEDSGK
jgi:hypothetical protein